MTYKHNRHTKQDYSRDIIVLILLYSCIALLITTTYFGLKCYMLDGEISKLERTQATK